MLREQDRQFLERKGWNWEVKEVAVNGGSHEMHVIVHGYKLPVQYRPDTVEIMVRIFPGYPEVGMDMFWTRPDVVYTATGLKPPATEAVETYDGLPWQRWSRHLNGWRPGVDNLETFFASIYRELNK